MALVDQRQLTMGAWLRRVLAVALAVAALAPPASYAQEPDPAATEQQRDDVRAQQAEVVLELDALEAKDAEVRAALAEIERNVATQRSELQQAERAQAQREAELAEATRAVADAQHRIDELNKQADQLVVDSFVNPPSDYALEPLRAGSITEAAVMGAVLEMQGDRDAQVLERLAQAHDSLETEQANKADATAEAELARQAAAQAVADVEAALAQQQAFAADVEERLNAKLAESESLRTLDAALSDRLAREQAELAAQLAAAQAAAAQPPPSEDVAPSQIAPAPGGLATVTCPVGGSITVAGSISVNVQALLDDAAADGVMLCGGGYRNPEEQIQLRMAHCGTSNYAIYQMPASQCSPPTAIPGTSMHEQGLAIDFTCNGGGTVSTGDECWDWLQANAAGYGLYNLPSESWHWSTNGN
ncbi:MAG TPA: D-alanyl-D-alanine carboxypeptidase family protein [Acidimicrobiales bacterium]|nr:D-alanyl-D-alanine carboxypeptidase family protein [Acidimicrobiales bacterium]